ncbi:hypothetical protein RE0356_49740 (plasmid) [Prescottella equi]|nr:hypothetical protein RE0356_49740 [Prescottella equi]
MGMRFGSAADEPDEEVSEHHRVMIEDYVERNLTRDDIERATAGEPGLALKDTDWHEIRSGVDQDGEVYFIAPGEAGD